MEQTENMEPKSFKKIFDEKIVEKIVIPIIQRDYAQGRKSEEVKRVREKFLGSLYDAVTGTPLILDFVYGNIDEIDRKKCLTPLDGQQRLTTLFLLHWYALKKYVAEKEKENVKVPESEYEFLKNFSYETRYSAREFCRKLVDYNPQFSETLSEQIYDQSWFPRDWANDPTISSMLVMLDAINDKFKNVPDIWDKLTQNGGCVKFYFLPLEKMGLTDDLYIRMNSRGKPLTAFEHFKAEFEKKMRAIDNSQDKSWTTEVMQKIDGKWTDLLWKYSTGDHIVDNRFLNYFRFICDIISFKNGKKRVKDELGEYGGNMLDVLEKFDAFEEKETFEEIEEFFDCWCDIPKNTKYNSSEEFLNSFMSKTHKPGYIKVGSYKKKEKGKGKKKEKEDNKEYTVLGLCLEDYESLSYGDTVLLYAITLYLRDTNNTQYTKDIAKTNELNNSNNISDAAFRRKIRIVNNLIKNSDDEMAIREQRNNMKNIIEQTEEIMLNGIIPKNTGFNSYQLDEERAKIDFLANNLQNNFRIDDIMFELEDHDLLYGQISIVEPNIGEIDSKNNQADVQKLQDFAKHAEGFISLFNCTHDKVDRALMAIGDYSQDVGKNERMIYQYGFGTQKSWENLFHKRSLNTTRTVNTVNYFENTHNILIKLLNASNGFTDKILDGRSGAFVDYCKDNKYYPLRYYYIAYDAYRPKQYEGLLYKFNGNPYLVAVMTSKTQASSTARYAFFELFNSMWSNSGNTGTKFDENQRLYFKNRYAVYANGDSYEVKDETKNKTKKIKIPQNPNGIDTVDRVKRLEKIIGILNRISA